MSNWPCSVAFEAEPSEAYNIGGGTIALADMTCRDSSVSKPSCFFRLRLTPVGRRSFLARIPKMLFERQGFGFDTYYFLCKFKSRRRGNLVALNRQPAVAMDGRLSAALQCRA